MAYESPVWLHPPLGFSWSRYKCILCSYFKTSLYVGQWPHCSRSKVYKVAGVQQVLN